MKLLRRPKRTNCQVTREGCRIVVGEVAIANHCFLRGARGAKGPPTGSARSLRGQDCGPQAHQQECRRPRPARALRCGVDSRKKSAAMIGEPSGMASSSSAEIRWFVPGLRMV
mmetsp:Transcript_59001/g.118008  ORF Transcript_59001/g.118008 Transcript_59001/m.118008 type:complete len:113 (+) Transcript_59001:116-454(+)